jgi:4-hydroxy-3-methylbut-2-enyl diphosphate reductase
VDYLSTKEGFNRVEEVEIMAENVRFGLPPEIVAAIQAAPPQTTVGAE